MDILQQQFKKMMESELFMNEFPEIISIETNYGEKEWKNEHDAYFEVFVPKSWYDDNNIKNMGKQFLYRRKILKRLNELSKYAGVTLPKFYPRITYV